MAKFRLGPYRTISIQLPIAVAAKWERFAEQEGMTLKELMKHSTRSYYLNRRKIENAALVTQLNALVGRIIADKASTGGGE